MLLLRAIGVCYMLAGVLPILAAEFRPSGPVGFHKRGGSTTSVLSSTLRASSGPSSATTAPTSLPVVSAGSSIVSSTPSTSAQGSGQSNLRQSSAYISNSVSSPAQSNPSTSNVNTKTSLSGLSSSNALQSSNTASTSVPASSIVGQGDFAGIIVPSQAGQFGCNMIATSPSTVNYYTCFQLATAWSLSIDDFFLWNPLLHPDCSNITPLTNYCVSGYIEPLRAYNGSCGPFHNNATCAGTSKQCCNSQTWTCGNSTADCAPGTCYEGLCPGNRIYTTDGTCGPSNGFRMCAGIWGSCCNMQGQCGNGPNFCGPGNCAGGNCTQTSMALPPNPPYQGNTTNGTCGGPSFLTCNSIFGPCCNANGVCGIDVVDCGPGCQPQFGNCSIATTSTVVTNSMSSAFATLSSVSSKLSSSQGVTLSGTFTGSVSKLSGSLSSSSLQSAISVTSASLTNMLSSKSTTMAGASATPNASSSSYTSTGMLSSSNIKSTASSSMSTASGLSSAVSSNSASSRLSGTTISSTSAPTVSSVSSVVPTSTILPGSSGSISTAFSSSSKPTSTYSTITAAPVTAASGLPPCGQTCFSNMQASYSSLGCSSPDPGCLCGNVNFGYGIRDCANQACGTAIASTVISFGSSYCSSGLATETGISSLPACGQLCMNNMISQYSSLGCSSPQPACLCQNTNFAFGISDCATQVCGTSVASTVTSFGSSYCASALATVTGISALPPCGQTCISAMINQYSTLGCSAPQPSCLCHNTNFAYGIRDCANQACGTAVAPTVISYGSSYCSSATASSANH